MSKRKPRRHRSCAVLAAAFWLGIAHSALAAPPRQPPPPQQTYATPDEAAAALAAATHANDRAALQAIFGPDSDKLLSSGDRYADAAGRQRFATAYDEKHVLVPQGEGRVVLDVGNNDWPLPIPIVQSGGSWHFDTQAGAQEIIDRRIGRNELAAIRVALTYVGAQKDYFDRMKQQTGTGSYAEHLVSRPGRQDGLYWPVNAGEAESPFGPLVDQAQEEGYPGEVTAGKPIPYQGYYFRILKGQGTDAPGGAMSYLKSGRMTDGFALLAWPARYGSSGIMTIQLNQDGIVFQKDLGEDTSRIASRIEQFDPDLTWARVEVTNE
jgi:hypothetical protein